VKSPSGASTLNGDSSPQEMNTLDEWPTRAMHEKVRFWTKKDFDDWMDSPEAQNSNRGLYAYMEEETGEIPGSEKLGNMRKALHAAWTDLAQRDLAPDTWGKASTTARSFIHSTMEKTYLFLKLAEDGWKLETLCTNLYSSWHLKRSNKDGKLKKSGHNVKEEALDDKDLEDHKPIAKKRKGQGTSRSLTKKPKGESLYMTHESTDWLTCCSGRFSCFRGHHIHAWEIAQPVSIH